ncbi:hypothetical protein FH729_12480 [Bacteroides thetaiotaomicron]|uniref:DUF6056 family protein n=1 Tax=Bacteroides thetaiotaomicron TaxID=818 RepID=UPI001926DBD5|nr:DUF6056 family protein [Bacteroides thetaiotaomicron]MBL3919401.1 hypothetical protein [Bacteroides thetaiotaomicron]MBL3932189.1 hypothetical protein [Bacteroides thetaiotaomicron]MBL3942954.1 hypothetical protein [Bacteroides thetaiotaomicron]MBL3947966.1 hypothetical protein [Bacteroides thetaiotaomicron]MBL3958366.1 hypothetical protein [Bacteroides thetaiotaomicron]
MSKKTVRIGIGAFLLIIGSLFYLMNMYTPICGDDYLYSFYLTPVAAKSFFEGASIGFEQKISSFTDVIFSQYNHYFYVNGRTIPHILEQSFAGLWGENCFNLINVFAFLLLNMLVIWISGKRNLTKFGYWVAAVFFIWFLLPCPVDLFLLMSGALNYTWSAVLCLAFLLVYTKVRQMERVNWGVAFLLFLLGVISGWTHESLVIGISGALFIIYCVQYNKRKPKSPEIALVAGFWLGTLLLCLSPAARGRASFDHPSIWETFLLIIGELRAFYVLLFLLVYTFFREKRNSNNHTLRKFFYDNQLYFYVILIELVFSLVIGFRNVRQLFGIELFSVVILIKLISDQTSFNAVWCRSVSIVAASAIVLHMAFVIPCAKRSHAQFQDIVTTYLHSEDGVVSFKYEEFPCWVDSYVWRFGGYAGWEAFCISVYYMGDKKPMKALLID